VPPGQPHERENCWLMTTRRTSLLVGRAGVWWERSHAWWTGGRSPSSLSSRRPGAAENQYRRRDQATAATTPRTGPRAQGQASFGRRKLLPALSDKAFCARSERSGDSQACPACLSIGRCRGLASGGRRRGFRGARQPFGNASLTQRSYGSQTSGKPVGALPRIRKTLTNQSSERWTPPRPVRQCAGPHLSTGGRHRAKPFQEGRCSSGRGCYGDAHGGLFVR
jgi:hypothetical protein